MKKLISILVLALCFWQPEFAQEKSVPQMLSAELSEGRVRMDFGYTILAKKEYRGSGTIELQDKCFKFSSGPVTVYNDGESLWSVDASLKEVVIRKGVPLDSTLSNEEIMGMLGTGVACDSVAPILSGEGKLQGLSCRLKNGCNLEVRITGIARKPKISPGDFTFDESRLDPSWVVTDLR